MTIYQLLTDPENGLGLPVAYGYFSQEEKLPFICLMGSGQDTFKADDTFYKREDRTQIEFYFKRKDPAKEAAIEKLLLDNNYLYEKSEDIYIENEDVFVIYYYNV